MATTHEETFDDFINGRLGKDEWTHEAHLVTCWMALRDRSPAQALSFLRRAIQEHNCGIGIANTDDSGYHETITVYYVAAVYEAAAATPEELFEEPSCDRTAALAFWTRATLFSTDARRRWVAPDIADLPWSVGELIAGD